MYRILLSQEGQKRFWTREIGADKRNRIMSEFLSTNQDILLIDFQGIEIIDYSFASELIAIPIARLAKELLGKHIILQNMNKTVEENVTAALDKAELCALVINDDCEWRLIGKCSEPLKTTFAKIVKLKKTDTPTLSQELDTTIPTLNNRLRVLLELGLIKREEASAPSGGRLNLYYSII